MYTHTHTDIYMTRTCPFWKLKTIQIRKPHMYTHTHTHTDIYIYIYILIYIYIYIYIYTHINGIYKIGTKQTFARILQKSLKCTFCSAQSNLYDNIALQWIFFFFIDPWRDQDSLLSFSYELVSSEKKCHFYKHCGLYYQIALNCDLNNINSFPGISIITNVLISQEVDSKLIFNGLKPTLEV